ncbi:uncharacterized protein LOC100176895 isoform X3 [Ciona intestinalis]
MGGHLAIIPDWETENFLRNKGLIYKYRTKNWMTSNHYAYIDAVKTSDGTGWEWSTTHDKFYFRTTPRGDDENRFKENGMHNYWHPQHPSTGSTAVLGTGAFSWYWISVDPSTVGHYICQIPVTLEYFKRSQYMFSPFTANHAGAKSACVGMGGHLAIIPDVETQAFIHTKGAAYKSAGKWMTSNYTAYIDAVKTSDGTGWEWSTTHDKFYFRTTPSGQTSSSITNGKFNNWHIYHPNYGKHSVIGSNLGFFAWSWKSASSSTVAHYICQTAATMEYYNGNYFIFSSQTGSHIDAKSACVELGGHLAIIPDNDTQIFIQTKGAAYKKAGKWMTSNYYAYIDAVKTLNETGWEWSTTHDKFYFKTTQRGFYGPFMVMGKYNNWHIYNPNIGGYGMISFYPGRYIWMWRTTEPSLQAHYICQINVKGSTLVAPTAVNIKYGEDSVICSSHGSPGPPVSWKINSEDVSINTSEPVYQIITQPTLNGNTSSRLYFTRALSQNSGVYTCNATSLNQSAQTTVKIDKRPRLLESKLETSTYACKFIGETSPTVHWSVNGVIVKENVSFITNTVLNTHEVLSQVSPLLIFGNKDIVSCWATTTDGSSNKVSKAGFSNPSSSAVIVSPGSCPGNQLQINWTDITKTTGNVVYNVSLMNSVQTYIKPLAQSSTKDNNYSITFDNLTPRTEYTVKIHFFPKYSSKIDQTLGRTAGEKPSIVSASANTDFNKTQCLISWLKGPETGIIGASIVVTSSLNKKALYMSDIVTTVTHTTLSQPYNFLMEPNRKHIITVATKTCSELSQYILVTGKCIS